jgi:translation initiation factor 3 subunit B
VDNAYWLWSFQGRLIRKHTLDRFCQLLWRPRPPTQLSEEKIKEIRKNLKNYSSQFDIKDRMALSKVSKDLLEKRKTLINEFQTYRQRNETLHNKTKQKRIELRNADTDNIDLQNNEIEEETVEFFVKEEIIQLEDDD